MIFVSPNKRSEEQSDWIKTDEAESNRFPLKYNAIILNSTVNSEKNIIKTHPQKLN